MEQNREPRNKLKYLWSINIWQRRQEIKWSKNSLFNKWCWEIWTATSKKMKLDHQHTPYRKINSRWIKYLYISHDTIKALEENRGRKISDIPCSIVFINMSPRARDIKERNNKWDYIKWNSFCTNKENIIKMEKELTVWENIFANDILDKGLISNCHFECKWIKFSNQKT